MAVLTLLSVDLRLALVDRLREDCPTHVNTSPVLAAHFHAARGSTLAYFTVLCLREEYERYVVWDWVLSDSGPNYAVQGFYTEDFGAAVEDLLRR